MYCMFFNFFRNHHIREFCDIRHSMLKKEFRKHWKLTLNRVWLAVSTLQLSTTFKTSTVKTFNFLTFFSQNIKHSTHFSQQLYFAYTRNRTNVQIFQFRSSFRSDGIRFRGFNSTTDCSPFQCGKWLQAVSRHSLPYWRAASMKIRAIFFHRLA